MNLLLTMQLYLVYVAPHKNSSQFSFWWVLL